MNIFKKISKWFKRTLCEYRLIHLYDRAVFQAELFSHKNKVRVFLVPDEYGKPTMLTKDGFKWAKKNRYMGKGLTLADLKATCIYYTADEYGRDPMDAGDRTQRRKDYILWWLECNDLA